MPFPRTPLAVRFESRYRRGEPDECWPWQGALNPNGYAYIRGDGDRTDMRYVHRVAYELAYGPIPTGYQVDHVRARGCTLRHCVNPAHLEAVTPAENNDRKVRRSTCPNGHEYTPENTYYRKSGRRCKACVRARNARQPRRQRTTEPHT